MPGSKKKLSAIGKKFVFAGFLIALASLSYFVKQMGDWRENLMIHRSFKTRLEAQLPAFQNQPLKDSFEIGGKKVYPAVVFASLLNHQDNEDAIDVAAAIHGPIKSLNGVAFEASKIAGGRTHKLLLVIDARGRLLRVTRLDSSKINVLSNDHEELFWMSLEGRQREDLPKQSSLKHAGQSARLLKVWLEMIEEGLEFFHANRSEIMTKSGVKQNGF